MPSDPSSVRPQNPGRVEASHASALRAVTATLTDQSGTCAPVAPTQEIAIMIAFSIC